MLRWNIRMYESRRIKVQDHPQLNTVHELDILTYIKQGEKR